MNCTTVSIYWVPRARGILAPNPLQNMKVTPISCTRTSHPVPRTGWTLTSKPLQNVEVTFRSCKGTSRLAPRARRSLASKPLQDMKLTFQRRVFATPFIEHTALVPQPLQHLDVSSGSSLRLTTPFPDIQGDPLAPQPLYHLEAALESGDAHQVSVVQVVAAIISLRCRRSLCHFEREIHPIVPTKAEARNPLGQRFVPQVCPQGLLLLWVRRPHGNKECLAGQPKRDSVVGVQLVCNTKPRRPWENFQRLLPLPPLPLALLPRHHLGDFRALLLLFRSFLLRHAVESFARRLFRKSKRRRRRPSCPPPLSFPPPRAPVLVCFSSRLVLVRPRARPL